MSQITFSKNMGHLEAGYDHLKILGVASKGLDYFASVRLLNTRQGRETLTVQKLITFQVCQAPELDLWLDKNPVLRVGPPSASWTVQFAMEQYQKRVREGKSTQYDYVDFLDRYIDSKGKNSDVVDDSTILSYLLANLMAGSDTTASTMGAAVYYILKHPSIYKCLREELTAANLSTPAQWKQIRDLPYLDAVMRESMRLNPGVGLLVERVVPKEGFTLPDGRFVQGGTIVGMNPWVINRQTAIFGPEPDSFIPERWLPAEGESDEAFNARLSKMKSTDFTFGAGPRICLGRNISLLESYKFIATVFNVFDVSCLIHSYWCGGV